MSDSVTRTTKRISCLANDIIFAHLVYLPSMANRGSRNTALSTRNRCCGVRATTPRPRKYNHWVNQIFVTWAVAVPPLSAVHSPAPLSRVKYSYSYSHEYSIDVAHMEIGVALALQKRFVDRRSCEVRDPSWRHPTRSSTRRMTIASSAYGPGWGPTQGQELESGRNFPMQHVPVHACDIDLIWTLTATCRILSIPATPDSFFDFTIVVCKARRHTHKDGQPSRSRAGIT